jgi:hypothetical protein
MAKPRRIAGLGRRERVQKWPGKLARGARFAASRPFVRVGWTEAALGGIARLSPVGSYENLST